MSEFLDENGEVDYSKMGDIADLPEPLSYEKFAENLKNSPNIISAKKNTIALKTPAGNVRIYLPYAYNHFF